MKNRAGGGGGLPEPHQPPLDQRAARLDGSREAITWFREMEEREQDKAPLNAAIIRRMLAYTRRYAARRNWLFLLTFVRGLQLPTLAWMIGKTINGPIAGSDLRGIFVHAGIYLVLALAMVLTLHFRQKLALE